MQIKFITAFVMGLLLVGSAFGDAGNSVYIDQTNADNSTLSVTQSGSDNKFGDPTNLSSPSFVIDGNNMDLTIVQDGMGNSITGNFIGGDSVGNISQTGNSNSTSLVYGSRGSNAGTLGITVNGSNNTTALTIGSTADASNYNYTLNITGAGSGTGNGNTVTSTMNSKNTTTSIALTGSTNTVTTNQSGGSGKNLAITTIGTSNNISVVQDGTNANSATINVTGNSTTLNLTQH